MIVVYVSKNQNSNVKNQHESEFWDNYWEKYSKETLPLSIRSARTLPIVGSYIKARMMRPNKDNLETGCGPMTTRYSYLKENLTTDYSKSTNPTRKLYSAKRHMIDRSFIGVDVSLWALKEAKENFPQGIFVNGSALQLPFPDRSIQVVSSFDTLSALGENAHIGISEMLRVASEEVIFTVAHEGQHRTDLNKGFKEFRPYEEVHGKLVDFDGWENIVFTYPDLYSLIKRQIAEDKIKTEEPELFVWPGFDGLIRNGKEDDVNNSYICVRIRKPGVQGWNPVWYPEIIEEERENRNVSQALNISDNSIKKVG